MVDVIHHYNYQLWWQLTTTVVAYIHHTSTYYILFIYIIYTPILVVYVAPVFSTKYGACWEHELVTFACNVGGVHSLHAKSIIRCNAERKRFQHSVLCETHLSIPAGRLELQHY